MKPENVLIGEDKHLRLIDFGDSKEFDLPGEKTVAEQADAYMKKKTNPEMHLTRPLSVCSHRIYDDQPLPILRLRIHYTRPWMSESTKLERESKLACTR